MFEEIKIKKKSYCLSILNGRYGKLNPDSRLEIDEIKYSEDNIGDVYKFFCRSFRKIKGFKGYYEKYCYKSSIYFFDIREAERLKDTLEKEILSLKKREKISKIKALSDFDEYKNKTFKNIFKKRNNKYLIPFDYDSERGNFLCSQYQFSEGFLFYRETLYITPEQFFMDYEEVDSIPTSDLESINKMFNSEFFK